MRVENFVAHRGYRQHYPENTLLAFKQAIAAGAKNIELDIQLSADGVPWVFHDAELQRLCAREGRIWDYHSDQLNHFSAYEPARLGDRFQGNPLCRLTDVVRLLQGHPDVNAYVEIKEESLSHFGGDLVVNAICDVLEPVSPQCILISFELDSVLTARRRNWQRCGAVFDQWPDWQLASLAEMAPEVIFIDRKIIPPDADLRQLPWPLLVYEVATATEARDWFERGVVAVETFLIGELLQEFGLAPGTL